ncbi:MAG: hypothetical protein R3F29_08865 [Planctomycetota bacterium]
MSPVTAPPPRPVGAPNRHKMVFLTWVGLYPTITCVLWCLLPSLLARFPLPVVTLIVTAIVVPLMSYVVMPLVVSRFDGWIRR